MRSTSQDCQTEALTGSKEIDPVSVRINYAKFTEFAQGSDNERNRTLYPYNSLPATLLRDLSSHSPFVSTPTGNRIS
jgi:hypothetical protein